MYLYGVYEKDIWVSGCIGSHFRFRKHMNRSFLNIKQYQGYRYWIFRCSQNVYHVDIYSHK